MNANTDPWADLLEVCYRRQYARHLAYEADLRKEHPEWFVITPTDAILADMAEVRVVDPETGGAKGSKLARFDMIPPDVLWELAEHYGVGERKYPSDPDTGQPNWQKGYDWRLSVAALQRHMSQFLQGEDFDEETGSSHLVAVMWHAAALRYFQLHGKGRDFRTVTIRKVPA